MVGLWEWSGGREGVGMLCFLEIWLIRLYSFLKMLCYFLKMLYCFLKIYDAAAMVLSVNTLLTMDSCWLSLVV